ncbi:MAG TPA: permease-like cell division protein FtsX [Prolixibacteraceae bacterium]|jgi:cell division transport system permease protein|nr:cell division protein FtsX [Bacteroidales bacterium]HNQ36908.1 permease-like cell division protein FtsX [Prolixibacteraceae bacterium]HOY51140.1 permease-like cell division protein FtsX [Prolixibacteraceae bacterium]HPJ78495.1 permease-like cell division protein FtsX [Prolixibacteraceae bacterium]HRV89966.1 permease-like cell division protein FtsX [Prolixibacteraceae bacterium]
MGKSKPKKLKERIFTSWLTSMVSITLVLFLLGLLVMILFNAGRLSDYVREKIGFTLVLREDLPGQEIDKLQKALTAEPWVKSLRYIDKESAAKELETELGEDFTGFLGFNPLFSSLEVKLFAPYTHSDSLALIEKDLIQLPQVREVFYQRSLVSVINENVRRISIFLLIFSGLMLFVFSVLINNTIRISVYSQRFIINNMMLVGATRRFVRRPFVNKSIMYGIYGALLSSLLLAALMFTYKRELSGMIDFNDFLLMGLVFLIVLAMGILLSWISTHIAVNRFLKMKFDEMFF